MHQTDLMEELSQKPEGCRLEPLPDHVDLVCMANSCNNCPVFKRIADEAFPQAKRDFQMNTNSDELKNVLEISSPIKSPDDWNPVVDRLTKSLTREAVYEHLLWLDDSIRLKNKQLLNTRKKCLRKLIASCPSKALDLSRGQLIEIAQIGDSLRGLNSTFLIYLCALGRLQAKPNCIVDLT
jgi:hypothetical protein